jgi:hypothetical protein
MHKAQIPARRTGVFPLPGGGELVLCSFTYKDWQDAKAQAMKEYKRQRIKTWTENADLLPIDMRENAIRDAFLKAEDITVDTLPRKNMKMPAKDDDGKDTLVDTEVDYVSWWLSETDEGKFFSLWLSARHAPGQETITIDEIVNRMMDNALALEEAAQEVGRMSQSELAKNSASPDTGAPTETTKTEPALTT